MRSDEPLRHGATLADVFARSEQMVGRRIADEFVLVPIVGHGAQLDAIYNLNRVGTLIWQQLDGSRRGEEIVTALVARFEVDRATAEADYTTTSELVSFAPAFLP